MQQWQISNQTMKLGQAQPPKYGPEEVLVEVQAWGINRADLLQVKGLYPAPAGYDSSVPGLEYAGTVIAVGERVQTRKVGDSVMGLIPSAGYSEQLAVHELETLSIPAGFSFAQAATLPEAFLTAYRALFIEGQLQPNQFCLIRPATAGVGLAAVQLANALGAIAIGSSRSADNLQAAQQLGLQHSVIENETLPKRLLEITGNQGVAVLMDMLGSQWNELSASVSFAGSIVLVGILAGMRTELNVAQLLMRNQRIQAMTMRSQALDKRIHMARIFNQQLAPLFARNILKPLPMETFAFADALQAHQHMLENPFSGKRVLIK